jgi:DNA-binding MarR family transcriptional regulator
MASLGRPVVVPGPGGYWLLGHETPSGIQTSIENFVTVMEARDWCRRHNIAFRVDLQGATLSETQIAVMLACGEKGERIAGVDAAAKTSIATVRKHAETLSRRGLMTLSPGVDRQRVGDRFVGLTTAGARVLKGALHG